MLEQIIQQFKGFSQVIQFIIESKKPVVAHNCLYDIMRIYHQFVDDLPSSYEDFKREFHKSFPGTLISRKLFFKFLYEHFDSASFLISDFLSQKFMTQNIWLFVPVVHLKKSLKVSSTWQVNNGQTHLLFV